LKYFKIFWRRRGLWTTYEDWGWLKNFIWSFMYLKVFLGFFSFNYGKFHKNPGQNLPEHFRIVPNECFLKVYVLKLILVPISNFYSQRLPRNPLVKWMLSCLFFAYPAIHAVTKLFITFDGLNRFFRMIACF
jgi:hypothetical protein